MILIISMTDTTDIKPIDAPTQLQIANMFLIGQTEEEISEQLNISVAQIKRSLASDDIQKYLDRTSSNTEMQMHLKRLKRAGEMLDPLLNQIELMINDPEFPIHKRKDSHVTLIKDVLLNKLPSTIAKTIWLAIQLNFGGKKQEIDTTNPELESIIKRMEPGQVLLFWDIIDKIGQLFLRGLVNEINEINDITNKVLDS